MFASLLYQLADTVIAFFCGILLLRFLMQWLRLPFRNPIGNFVLAATDWLVRPLRRFIPGLFGLDLASLLPAWLLLSLLPAIALTLQHGAAAMGMVLAVLIGILETVRLVLYLVVGSVLGVVILSWINPYSPVAPLLHGLADPFLKPFQRIIPPVGGVDLSPFVLLLLFQVVFFLLDTARHTLVGTLF